jgi:hypothetical protein
VRSGRSRDWNSQELLAGERIPGLNLIVGGLQIEHAVHLDRRHLERLGDAGLDDGRGPKLAHIAGIDLGERREALIVVGAPVQDPVVRPVRLQHHRVGDIHLLRHRLVLEAAGARIKTGNRRRGLAGAAGNRCPWRRGLRLRQCTATQQQSGGQPRPSV